MRQEIECRKALEHAHRIGGAQHGNCTRQPNATRARRGSTEDHDGSGVEEFLAVVFANAEDVQPNLVRIRDLFHQFAEALGRAHGEARVAVRCREAIDSNLH